MSKKYPKQPIACCDCGLVHTMGFTADDKGILRLEFERNNRATSQLRRGCFAYLKNPIKKDKWKMVRK